MNDVGDLMPPYYRSNILCAPDIESDDVDLVLTAEGNEPEPTEVVVQVSRHHGHTLVEEQPDGPRAYAPGSSCNKKPDIIICHSKRPPFSF